MAVDFLKLAASVLRNTVIVPNQPDDEGRAEVLTTLVRRAADNPELLAIAAKEYENAHKRAVEELLFGRPLV